MRLGRSLEAERLEETQKRKREDEEEDEEDEEDEGDDQVGLRRSKRMKKEASSSY